MENKLAAKILKKLITSFGTVLALLILLPVSRLQAADDLRFKGDYFLFSQDHEYLYGGGNIELKGDGKTITAQTLYFDVKKLCGVLYGNVKISYAVKTGTRPQQCDALFFQGMPPKWLRISYGDTLRLQGHLDLERALKKLVKRKPEELRDSSIYFEFREFGIDKNRKIKAKTVIPYMMGLPTVPLKRFTVNRGKWADKTMLAFNNINYTDIDGLSLSLFLRLREPFAKGDYDLKLYERNLFKLAGIKRGAYFSGKGSFLVDKKDIFNYSVLFNSGDKSFNTGFRLHKDFKFLKVSFSQNVSGKDKVPVFFNFISDLTLKKLKYIIPHFRFSHDLRKSYSYGVSTPFKVWKKLSLNASWQRKIIKDTYRSDTSTFSCSLGYNASFFSLSSNYNFSRNLIEESVKKNFAVTMKLKSLLFLEDNVSVDVSTFYMFSAQPYVDGERTRVTPGVNVKVVSFGAGLPLGFRLAPVFTFNHLWDNREESFTDFNYSLALQKDMGIFSGSLEYALASRYRAENFWIEGSGRKHMNVNLSVEEAKRYAFRMRFYFNNKQALETISFSGKVFLPYDLTFSPLLLYYKESNKFRTVEIFVEKTFKKKIKIQGGYSLALKRFFIKLLIV
ncbi:MAG: hypothetical protein GY765_00640 [bacterium]|nr:hypothetical protein [bacterium]